MSFDDALIFAYLFDGSHPATQIGAAGIESREEDAGWLWLHLDRTDEATEPWLRDVADLDTIAVEALLAEETRPRVESMRDGLLVILRGVNLNPGADPDDMISIRAWIDAKRVITLRARRLMAIEDLQGRIAKGYAPAAPSTLLVDIADAMIDRMAPVLDDLGDAVDQIEEDVLDAPSRELRAKLSDFRRQAINLRRYLAPQREVLARLYGDHTAPLGDTDRFHLRETLDRLTRYVEELDAARDRAAVTQEEVNGRMADQMNSNMYLLSLVAGIFLPLGLLTGLLGINVGGMPGVDSDWAFALVCVILVVLAGIQWWLFRRFRLL